MNMGCMPGGMGIMPGKPGCGYPCCGGGTEVLLVAMLSSIAFVTAFISLILFERRPEFFFVSWIPEFKSLLAPRFSGAVVAVEVIVALELKEAFKLFFLTSGLGSIDNAIVIVQTTAILSALDWTRINSSAM